MKIALLLEREPFATIFEATLSHYLEARTGRVHKVKWNGRPPLPKPPSSRLVGGSWLCNPRINAVFSTSAQSSVFELPWREYLRGRTRLRTAVQAAYLMAATAPLTRNALAEHDIHIEPDIPNASQLLIIGGNTRLKIFDYASQQVTTVLKQGFDKKFIFRDIEVRHRHPWLPAPEIGDVLDSGQAYVEPLIHGTVADRLRNRATAAMALQSAIESIIHLESASFRSIPSMEWLSKTVEACKNPAFGPQKGREQTVERTIAMLELLESRFTNLAADALPLIGVAESHGDLQPGNVVVSNEGVSLIDWERTDERIAGYDCMTLALDSRRRIDGLVARISELAEGRLGTPGAEHARLRLAHGGDRRRTGALIAAYLLEELRFHLEECTAGPLYGPTRGLSALLHELEQEAQRLP